MFAGWGLLISSNKELLEGKNSKSVSYYQALLKADLYSGDHLRALENWRPKI